MPRKTISEEEKREHRKIYNDKDENKEKRCANAKIYYQLHKDEVILKNKIQYEKKKLQKYFEEHQTYDGFKYKYLTKVD